MIRTSPFDANSLATAFNTAATLPTSPLGEICAFCTARFRVEAHYDDPWRTPLTLRPLLVEYTDGAPLSDGGRTRALATFGLQDGQPINAVRPELGTFADRAPRAGAITARLVPENAGDPAALEAQIIADLAAFARSMETEMRPWNDRWQNEGWTGLFASLGTSIATGFETWQNGETEFWSSLTTWLSSLPDQLGAAWDTLSESAKALWNNRDKILALLQNLAEGSVAAFEAGLEAVAAALQSIPGLEEIAKLLKDLVSESAEWAGAMIEMATQTRVLAVLGFTMLSTVMLIPPNFWTDMIGKSLGYLIPEVIIAIVLAVIAFFTAGTGGTLLATRIATYTTRITAALSRGGPAGRALMAVFTMMNALMGKMIALIKALKGKIDEIANGTTDAVTAIVRRTSVLREAYRREVRALSTKVARLRAEGKSPEEIARIVSADRRALGVKYKSLTPPDVLEKIYARNLEKYGDPLGPTIEYLRTVRYKTWDEIIESAIRPGGGDLGL